MVAVLEVGTNNNFFASFLPTVNSPPVPHRDITGASTASYRPYNEEYVSVQRHIDRPVQTEIDVERTKKDKKWSIGKLFRRKKKEDESGTSSQSDDGGTRSPSKKKSKKKKRAPPINNFDHIVIRDSRRAQSLAHTNVREANDDGVLSDPSAGFIKYKADKQEVYSSPKEVIQFNQDISRLGKGILEAPSRKKRKSRLKARVEALRNSIRGESSSDEESLKSSSNSSSMIRFRSDDSLMRSRDSSLNKRSRNARNERYIKRLSRDDENQLNKEAELLQQGYTKAEVEMLTRTPTSQSSGYGTCKRDGTNKIPSEQLPYIDTNRRPMKSESISSFPSTQSYPSSINFNAKVNNERINYSIQYPNNNTNRGSLYINSNRESSISNQYETPENIMCVKFPLGNVTNIKKEEKAPPVPPPRDMHRKVVTPLSMYYDNSPVMVDRTTNYGATHGVTNNDFERIMRRSQERLVGYGLNGLRRPISNSEDHIAIQNNENIQSFMIKNEQPRRPASVSAEPNHYGSFINSPPWRKSINQTVVKPEPIQLRQDYLYYADQSPRSRRPISIQTSQNGYQNQYLSDSQMHGNNNEKVTQRPRNASEFWKKIDDAERQRKQQNIFANSRSCSEYSSSSQINRPYLEQKKSSWNRMRDSTETIDSTNKAKSIDVIDGARVWKATTEYKRSTTLDSEKTVTSPPKTHTRHKSDTFISNTNQVTSDDEKNSERRKSTNLDDALNELEAIYNSLGLGDEDLLDRAERRELMTPKFNERFNDWNGNDDEVQLRSQPSTPLRRISRRSTLPDKLQDDMAFRRMNSFSSKEKPNINDTQSQISYMLASPVYVPYASDDDRQSERNEPDVVFDDVVYRNIKQTNNRLKTLDPQPPFGIPVGPISPAPQSDYLHAKPENKGRSRFVPKRSPDIVADDLAYRSLRKDNRHSSLFNGENYIGYTNNNGYSEFPLVKDSPSNIKKKRAVRSLSANIFTMIQKEIDEALNINKAPIIHKTNSNSDVMKRLRDTFEKNDNQKEYVPRNKVKQRHNTVDLFVNSTHTPSHHFAKDDTFIISDDICLAKPPSCDKSKSSSPSNRSPQTSKRSSKDEFQQVLSMLAQEAMDTSNKLGVALAELDKNRNKNEITDLQTRITDSRTNFLNGLTDPCQNSEFELNHNSKNLTENFNNEEQSKAKKTEDSLLLISDQLHKVEDQLKCSFDKEMQCKEDSLIFSNNIDSLNKIADNIETRTSLSENKIIPDVIPKVTQKDSDKDTTIEIKEKSPTRFNSLNPFLNTDDNVNELNEIKAFKELKEGISDLIAGIAEVNDKLFVSKSAKQDQKQHDDSDTKSSKSKERLIDILQKDEHVDSSNRESTTLSIYEDDIDAKKDTADSTEYNSSEELATIFKLDYHKETEKKTNNDKQNSNCREKRNDLDSPNLVKTMSEHLRRCSVDESTSQSNITLPTNIVPWRAQRQNNNSHNENKGDNAKSKRNWHGSGTLMLACSYTLMLSQHLADLDWLTLLGMLLAIVTIIAMLII